MGVIISVFKYFSSKESIESQLERQCKQIDALRKRVKYSSSMKFTTSALTTVTSLLFLFFSAYLCYHYGLQSRRYQRSYTLFAFALTVVSVLLNFLFRAYYRRVIARSTSKLKETEEQFKSLLLKTVDELPYRKAYKLLETYGSTYMMPIPTPDTRRLTNNSYAGSDRSVNWNGDGGASESPSASKNVSRQQPGVVNRKSKMVLVNKDEKRPGENPPFPTFANRSLKDKIVDKLIGDNPYHRYALICSFCKSNNGLMPPESTYPFEFLCYMCNSKNTLQSENHSNLDPHEKTNSHHHTQERHSLFESSEGAGHDESQHPVSTSITTPPKSPSDLESKKQIAESASKPPSPDEKK